MNNYKGLGRTLRFVRGTQNYAAVVAEVLILLSFALSSLDISVGGRLASIPWLPWLWGAIFALGVDTSFVLSWVRVRQSFQSNKSALWWSIPLAFRMSFIVFQPVAIQQLQQALGITFQQSLSNLGVDLNFLVYARSFVGVLLGAILALTNVEAQMTPDDNLLSQPVAVKTMTVALDVSPVAPDPEIVTFPFEQATFHSQLAVAPVIDVASPVAPNDITASLLSSDVALDDNTERLVSQDVAVSQPDVAPLSQNVTPNVAPLSPVASLSQDDVAPVASDVAPDDNTGRLVSQGDDSVSHLLSQGMTVRQIADMRGVSVRTVQRWLAKEREA